MPRTPRSDRLALSLACVAMILSTLAGQEGRPLRPESALEGKPVVDVEVTGRMRGSREAVLAALRTRKGKPFSAAEAGRDVKRLWDLLGLKAEVLARKSAEGVLVRFEVQAFRAFERFTLVGLHALSTEDALKVMDLREGESLAESFARTKRDLLLARYDRMGYPFAKVDLEPSEEGETLIFRVEEGPKVRVRSIRIKGNKAFPADTNFGLRKNLLGSGGVSLAPHQIATGKLDPGQLETWLFGPLIALGALVDRLIPAPPYSAATLEENLENLRRFYQGEGYRDARVEAADVSFSPARNRVDIVILVEEGPLYRVARVDLEQRLPTGRPEPVLDKQALLAKLQLSPGDPYRLDAVRLDEKILKDEYGKHGFPHYDPRQDDLKPDETFEVLDPLELFDPETATVTVTYRLREGYPKRLRQILISGNENTKDQVIRREIDLHPGDALDMVKLQDSLYRLDALQYFEDQRGATSVRRSLRSVPDSPEEVDLAIDLREGKTGNILWSAGVSSNLGFFGRFTLRRRNFDLLRPPTTAEPIGAISQILGGTAFYGGGQTLTLDLQPGSKFTFFNLNFQEPDLFGLYEERIGLSTNVYKKWRYYEDYRDERLGVSFRLSRQIGRRTRVFAGMTNETVLIADLDGDAPFTVWESEGSSEFRSIDLGADYDGTDHPLQPASGLKAGLETYFSGGPLKGDDDLWGLSANTQFFLPVWEDGRGRNHVLSLRGDYDWVVPYSDDDLVHVARRLYLGGRGSLRGFRFRGAGPTQFGNPVGGEARWLASMEYQLPLFSILPERGDREIDMVRLVFFADAGGLGTELSDPTFQEARVAVGFGVRIRIPGLSFLPLALDFGFPVVSERTDDGQVLSFVLGMY